MKGRNTTESKSLDIYDIIPRVYITPIRLEEQPERESLEKRFSIDVEGRLRRNISDTDVSEIDKLLKLQ